MIGRRSTGRWQRGRSRLWASKRRTAISSGRFAKPRGKRKEGHWARRRGQKSEVRSQRSEVRRKREIGMFGSKAKKQAHSVSDGNERGQKMDQGIGFTG